MEIGFKLLPPPYIMGPRSRRLITFGEKTRPWPRGNRAGEWVLFCWIRGCFLLAVALHILLGRHAVEVVEDGGEVVGIVEAGEVSNFGDRHLLLGEEFGGLGESDVADIASCRLVSEFLEFAIEVDAAQTYLAGDIVGGEVGVAEVLVDDLDDLLEETLVGRLEFGRSDLLGR